MCIGRTFNGDPHLDSRETEKSNILVPLTCRSVCCVGTALYFPILPCTPLKCPVLVPYSAAAAASGEASLSPAAAPLIAIHLLTDHQRIASLWLSLLCSFPMDSRFLCFLCLLHFLLHNVQCTCMWGLNKVLACVKSPAFSLLLRLKRHAEHFITSCTVYCTDVWPDMFDD